MSLRSLVQAWNEFFFTPQPPTPIAFFRVFYGMLLIANLVFLRPDWLAWYGQHSWVTLPTMLKLEPSPRLNLFTIMPHDDRCVEVSRLMPAGGPADVEYELAPFGPVILFIDDRPRLVAFNMGPGADTGP